MPILPLKRFRRSFLSLAIEVWHGRQKLLDRPLYFVVDTAAHRTFVSPETAATLSRAAKKKRVKLTTIDSKRPAETLWGKMRFETIYELILKAQAVGQGPIALDGKQGVSVMRSGVDKREVRPPNVNVIGMDVLSRWTLIREPFPDLAAGSNRSAALLTKGVDVHQAIHSLKCLDPYFKRPPRDLPDAFECLD